MKFWKAVGVICVYFYRFFRTARVSDVHDGMVNSPTANPYADMLKCLGYNEKVTELKKWHKFIRKATFFLNTVNKDYETKVIPSWDALALHCKRANYVLNITSIKNQINCGMK